MRDGGCAVTGRPIRILAVEDVAAELALVERTLKHAGLTCSVERVETAYDFRRGLESGPDLILCDFNLQQFDGLAALEIANARAPGIPFIFLSGAIGEERVIEALKSGATDYVLKSNLGRLLPAIVRAFEDRDQRRIARQSERRFRDLVEASQDWVWELDAGGRYVYSSPSVRTLLGWTDAEILGTHYLAHVHEDDRAEIEGAMRLPEAKGRDLTTATVRIGHRDGGYRWLERHALTLIDEHGLIAGFRGTDRDVTDRRLEAAHIERLSRIQMMLSSLDAAVLRIRDRPELLHEACRIAVTQGGYPAAAVLLVEPRTATARGVASAGVRIDLLEECSVTQRATATSFSSLTEEALATARPVICHDLADPARIVHGREEMLAQGLRALSSWPLSVDGNVVGALDLGSLDPNGFDEEELSLLRQAAGSLSFALQYIEKEDAIMPPLAVANRSNGVTTRRAANGAKGESDSRLASTDAVAREREDLAYELHDGVCQELAGILFHLEALLGPVVRIDSEVARELEHVATLLREAIQTARSLAQDRAGAAAREPSDLQGALQAHAARLQAAHGVTIQVDATAVSGQPLSEVDVSELAKLSREAMRNAIRHGRARSIIVRLKDAGNDWQLEISDDGVGLPGDFASRGGLGLRGMRHRAARLQGTFEIVRLAPGGTRLRVS